MNKLLRKEQLKLQQEPNSNNNSVQTVVQAQSVMSNQV